MSAGPMTTGKPRASRIGRTDRLRSRRISIPNCEWLEACLARTKSYGQLTDAEKWQWHADVYAFRRIVLEVPPDEQTSPCDPGGEWLNEELIRAAAARLQLRRDRGRMERKRVLDEQRHREGRALCDAWARKRGYADFATAEKAGVKWSEVAASF